jgi:hypothetical protein
MWLQKKFPPGNLMELQLTHSRREETGYLIGQGLANSDKLTLKHCYIEHAEFYRQTLERNTGRQPSSRRRRKEAVEDDNEWH